MIWLALMLAAVGLFLSAFFSGSETGFYRATRMRLVIDALGGDPIARGLLWLANHPSMFVATTLVGNNLANYVTSLAIVVGVQAILGGGAQASSEGGGPQLVAAELIAPLLFAPLLFVYGELLPKHLFLNAPNRLLRAGGPLFLLFVPLFLPVSLLLWGLNRIIGRLVAEAPERVRLTLARRELQRVLEEGHEAGILHPSQVELARGIFAVANHPVTRYVTPLSEVARARSDMTKAEVRGLARRLKLADVPVEGTGPGAGLVGYVRVIDLSLAPGDDLGPVRRLLEIPHTATHIDALMEMHSAGESLARVVDTEGQTLGMLTAADLRRPLLRGAR